MKNTAKPTIQIYRPCDKNFEDFEAIDKNCSFCESCAMNVYDFSSFTQEEFIEFFSQDRGVACGRFRRDQVAFPQPKVEKTNWVIQLSRRLKIAAVVALSFLGLASCSVDVDRSWFNSGEGESEMIMGGIHSISAEEELRWAQQELEALRQDSLEMSSEELLQTQTEIEERIKMLEEEIAARG